MPTPCRVARVPDFTHGCDRVRDPDTAVACCLARTHFRSAYLGWLGVESQCGNPWSEATRHTNCVIELEQSAGIPRRGGLRPARGGID